MPLIYDSLNPKSVMIHAYLNEFMSINRLPPELHVVIGGDGFMLRTVRQYYGPDVVFLGINCGHLGFLLNDIPMEMRQLPDLIMSGELHVQSFPRIAMEAQDLDGNVLTATALNDIYLERMTGQTCHLKVQIDGTTVVNEIVCDGLIMATALGSTAYSFSAGGAVCHPSLRVIAVTAICPHVPRLAPLLMPLEATVVVEVTERERRKVRAVADGVDYERIARMKVFDARAPVKLAFFPGHDFTGTLVSKVLHA